MFNVKGIAQLTGTVPVQTPTGGFAVEGDAYANTPTAGIGDWFADYGTYPGTGGGLFNLDGSVIDPTMSYFLQDGWKGGPVDLTVFATDNKINQNPNDYYWKRGDAPAKNEIENVGVHFTYGSAALGGNPDDLWCLFAGDRMVTNGDSYLDFEFLQKPLTMVVTGQDSQGYDNGKFESQGLDGGRTVGDLLVTIEFHNGGVTATIVIQRWEFVSGTYKYVVYPNSDFVGSIYATNNTVLTNVPFDAFGENYYVVNQWAEGAINLTQVLNLGQNPCYNLSTVFVRTRTSGESGTSQLKDFPGGPIQLNLNLSKLAVHCPTPVTLPSCTSVADLQTAFSNWKDGFSNSGGIEPVMEKFEDLQGNSVNIYNLLPPERCGGTVELKYIITDYCGVTKNCTSSFTILPDHDAPVFAPAPEEVMVSCIGDVPAMTELGWTDNCDGEGSVEGKDVSDGKSCPETITRSWYYMDACGNEAFASQTIVVHDQIAPVFAPAPEEVMVSCIGDVPAMTELGWTDNCDGEGSVEGKDVSDGKSCPETITRSWYYMDACGNEAFASQTIVVHDQIAPVFAPAPEEVMVSCIGDVPAMTELGWTDNCDGEGSVEGKDVSDGKSCPETITRSWYYMDACGNEAFASQTIVVHDQIAPVFAPAPEEVMVSCIGDVPAMTELGWTDNCDGEGSVEGKDVSDGKSCPETITRSWYYMDACGNEAFASQTIVVHDQIAPVFAPAPEEVMVSCIGDVPAMTELGWTDNCDGEGSVEGKDVSDGKSCPETITRSWYYMDACGNEAFASQTIVVHDQIAPVFAPAPEEVMVSCIGDVPAMTELGWTDNCDGEGSVEGKDVSDGKSCPETITRSWYYMDACGNEAFASQTIVVHDQIAPVFAPAPEEVMVSCIGDVPAMTELGWTDNCDGEGSVEGKDVSDGKSCPETITRSWYYMDACGNEAFASQTIVVHDQIAPVFAPAPEEVMVSCIGDVPAMTELGWTDNCDGEGSVEGKDVSDGKSCPETITRSWYYMDACGNEAFASQTIVVHDQIAPVFAPAPEEVMVSCIGDVPAMTELGWTDNCDGEGSVEGKDVSDGKSCPETITRSWYYMDACGNEAFASQTIVVHDQIAPVFAPAPEEVMVSCIGDVPAMTELGWTDNCDGEGSVEGKDVSDGKSCPETITRSWYYMDACGNEAFASQTIVVHDQIAPVFAPAPEEVMVSCIGDVPAMTELGWTDNCDGEGSVEGKDVSDGKSCPETITRSWYYMDACGNEAFASQTIVVHDQIAPVFAPAPEEVMVSCIGDVPAMTELGWTDNCDGEGSVEGKDVSDGKSCPETITRSWYYMDACGNEAFASQTIVVHDQIAPVFAPAPEEVMVSCIGDVPAMTELGWTDNCDGEGSVEGKDVSDGKSCPETITRSWYYMDACGNEAFASQTIVVHDQIAPVFAPAPEEVMVSCIGDVPAMTELGWTDNCDGEGSVEGKDVSDGKSCPETITRSWYYMDACGNEAFASQTIVVHDQIAPVFAPAPEEVMVSCIGDVPAMTELGWTDNCDGEGSVEGKDVSDGKSCPETITRSWYYMDACGNEAFASQTIVVHDQIAPVFAPAPEEVMVSCIGDVPAMTELGWTDNCDGEGSVEGKDVSDGKSCPETITRSWYYMDACGNEAFASQTIVVHDQIAPVFAPAPEEVMVSCIGDVPAMTELGWTDNCDGEGSVEGKDVSDGKSCPETITRSWYYMDACGNEAFASQTIVVHDQIAPVFAPAPEEVMVSCIGDVPAMTELGWTDNCDGEGSVEGKDVSDGKSCPETITRSWYYMDACGNEAFASQTIVVHDQIAPVFAPAPEEVMVSCIGDVPAMTELGWTDNCDGEGSVEGKDVSDGKSCPETITRSWYYMDACGNEAFASQTIVVHDQIAPVFAPAPEEVMVSCIGDVPAMTELGWTDNCDGEGSVEGKDVSDGKSCPETITRSWYYMDACGNEAFASQTIVVHDQIAPVFAPAPEEVMVSCIGDVPAMTELGWTDNCDGEGSVEGKDVSDGKSCPETITRSWYYMDACGNEAFASQTIVVHDQIAPVFAPAPEEVMVSCIGDVPAMTELGWTDNCDGEGSVEGKDVSDGKSCPETITRSWYYMDACGNEAFASQTIVVHDQIAPVFAPAPEEVMVSCIGDVPAMTELGWTDNCDGEGSVEGKDVSDGKSCPETITRSWYYMDACGNEAFASQTIVVHDQIAPVFAPAPEEVMVSCIGDVPAMTELGWTDNCDGEGSVEGKDVSDGKSCPETITRSWYYMDACGNEAFASQTIVVHDQIAPVIQAPEDYSVCDEILPEYLEATWTDNCSEGGTLMAYGVPYSSDDCSITMAYTFTVADACGNEATEVTYLTRNIEVTHCETAYAKLEDENAVCFLSDGFDRWGWTNMISEEGSYTLPIYQGAAQCDSTKGQYVGNVYVTYSDGTVTVEYDVMDGYFMSEAHVYIGCEKYPVFKKKPTVAPGQYTFNAGGLDHVNHLTVTFDVSDYDGPFYLIAHAVTCETICTCYDYPEGGGTSEPYYMNVTLDCVAKTTDVVETTPIEPAKLKIYPVPFEDSIDVQYRFDYKTDVTIQVYNLLGVLIYETTDSKYVKSQDSVKHIDLPRTSAQTLVVKIITNKEELSKLIISK